MLITLQSTKDKEVTSSVIKLIKKGNAGVLNHKEYNVCWLASALQVLEVTPLPLILQGNKNTQQANVPVTYTCETIDRFSRWYSQRD